VSSDEDQDDLPLVEPLSLITARTLVRSILSDGTYTFGAHAIERLAERDMTQSDVLNILRAGNCLDHAFEKGTYRYRFETPRGYCAVIAFRSATELVVITAWKK
jgi:hypothetical protein